MKKKAIIYLGLLFVAQSIFAKVITVDNNTGTTANFTNLAEAITAAINGDTLYVHPSQNSYGSIALAKKLAIIGPGHHPSTAGNVTLDDVTLKTGSSGSVISGLALKKIWAEQRTNTQVHDILIENNLFLSLYTSAILGGGAGSYGNTDNWVIRGNVFPNLNNCGNCTAISVDEWSIANTTNENWFIYNNLFLIGNNHAFSNLNASSIISNNTIIIAATNPNYYVFKGSSGSHGANISNNIFIVTHKDFTNIAANCNNCTFTNNLTYNPNATLAKLPGTGNIDNKSPDFVQVPFSYAWSYDHDYNVSSSSAAYKAGTDGTDIGVYGGKAFRFNINGYPTGLPFIEMFRVNNPQLISGEKVNVEISTTIGTK